MKYPVSSPRNSLNNFGSYATIRASGNSDSGGSNNDDNAGRVRKSGVVFPCRRGKPGRAGGVVVSSMGLVAAGLFSLVLGLVGLLEDRKIAQWEKRHVRSLIRGRLYLLICRLLDIALIGGGLFAMAKGIGRVLNYS